MYKAYVDYDDIQSALSDVHINSFMNFLKQSRIKFNLRKIPYRALKNGLMFDQTQVNVYMRFIAAGYEIHPVVEDKDGNVIDGENRAQAFSQLEMLVPTLRIDFPDNKDLITLVSEYKDWCKDDGANDVNRWIMGSGF